MRPRQPEVDACLEGDYQPMEKFKPFELLNHPIRSRVTEGDSTFEPTTHAQIIGRLGRIGAFAKWKPAFRNHCCVSEKPAFRNHCCVSEANSLMRKEGKNVICRKESVRKAASCVDKNAHSEGGLEFRQTSLIFLPFYNNREAVTE